MSCLSLQDLSDVQRRSLGLAERTADERAQDIAAWTRRTCAENQRRKRRLVLDVASFAIAFTAVCYLVAAHQFGWWLP